MKLQEGLKAGDLEGVVSKRISVDQFKSKMGQAVSYTHLTLTTIYSV